MQTTVFPLKRPSNSPIVELHKLSPLVPYQSLIPTYPYECNITNRSTRLLTHPHISQIDLKDILTTHLLILRIKSEIKKEKEFICQYINMCLYVFNKTSTFFMLFGLDTPKGEWEMHWKHIIKDIETILLFIWLIITKLLLSGN